MYFRSLKDHPHWPEAAQEILKTMDPDLVTLIHEVIPAPFPPADIYATNDEISILLALPGWQESDELTLSVSENLLEIKGFKNQEQVLSTDALCQRQETFYGPFTRTIALPYRIDPEGFSVKYSNGVLKIHFQRCSEENDLD